MRSQRYAARVEGERELAQRLETGLKGGAGSPATLVIRVSLVFARRQGQAGGPLVSRFLINITGPLAMEGGFWRLWGGLVGGGSAAEAIAHRSSRVWTDKWRACLDAAQVLDAADAVARRTNPPTELIPSTAAELEECMRFFKARPFHPDAMDLRDEYARRGVNWQPPQLRVAPVQLLRRAGGVEGGGASRLDSSGG
jgi:hypothetical protein